MPKGLKRALKMAHHDSDDSGNEDDEEIMMELEAAKQIMEEQARAKAEAEGIASQKAHIFNKVGLEQKLKEVDRPLPWAEMLVTRGVALEVVDASDDLQREVAFYQNSLSAVRESKIKLRELGIPFKRSADFLCEMIKSDAHMDKIKDKLIFEQKKMEAFQKRQDRTEQRKYSKAVGEEKKKEKIARKKEGLDAIDQWRKDAKAKRGGGGLQDDDGLEGYLGAGNKRKRTDEGGAGGRGGGKGGPGAGFGRNKRVAKDAKYGHGGIPGRLKKANDSKSINDMTNFNPKKGKIGAPTKGKGKGNKGGSRPGKTLRDKARSKKR